jgi:hypothetical protein
LLGEWRGYWRPEEKRVLTFESEGSERWTRIYKEDNELKRFRRRTSSNINLGHKLKDDTLLRTL